MFFAYTHVKSGSIIGNKIQKQDLESLPKEVDTVTNEQKRTE